VKAIWTCMLAVFALCLPLAHAQPTVSELLAAIDANMTFEARYVRAKMEVVKPRRTKVYELQTWGRGADDGATEFLAPAREAGTKMLKRGDELWMYLPSVEKTQKISGHMLRQGLMGSDMSYEDLLESSGWFTQYTGIVEGLETYNDRPCWKLILTAKTDEVSYPKRVVWVDQAWNLPVKQELYAVSGMLLKEWLMEEPRAYGERMYPSRFVIIDRLQEGTRTTVTFYDMDFGVALDANQFSMRWLER
jgi:outer membrane lipoprotein-sorting protein